MTHAFLIRDPAPMLASLEEKLGRFDLEATGLPQQVEIFDDVVRRTGSVPPVVDAADLLAAPEAMLRALCTALGRPVLAAHAVVAGRTACERRHLGEALVRAGRAFDRLRACGGRRRRRASTADSRNSRRRCRPLYEKLRAHRLRA